MALIDDRVWGVGATRLQEALVFHDQESLLLSLPTYVLEFILAGSLCRLPQPDVYLVPWSA